MKKMTLKAKDSFKLTHLASSSSNFAGLELTCTNIGEDEEIDVETDGDKITISVRKPNVIVNA